MKNFLKTTLKASARHTGNEGGWAIMSAMIAIFVGLIMMAGIFGLVQISLQGSKVQEAQNNLSTIRTSIQQLFAGQPDYSGLNNSLAISANMVPESMVSGSNILNAWSGDVTVSTGSSSSTFSIQYDDVPEEACIKFAPFGYGTWTSVDVGGSSISQNGGTAVSDAVSACGSGGNSITFTSN